MGVLPRAMVKGVSYLRAMLKGVSYVAKVKGVPYLEL